MFGRRVAKTGTFERIAAAHHWSLVTGMKPHHPKEMVECDTILALALALPEIEQRQKQDRQLPGEILWNDLSLKAVIGSPVL
jgi:hypothetical protein